MRKVSVFFYLVAVLTVAAFEAVATTPMEAFIARMKTANTFAPVSNIWQADNNFDKKELLQYVEDAQPLSIDYANVAAFMQQKSTAISLIIPGVNGGSYTIELGRYEFLTNDFEVHARGENGEDKRVNYTPGLYYRGVVKGYPGSVAAFSFFNNEIYGVFSIPNEGNYVLVPNSMTGKEYDYNPNYLLYNDALLKIKHLAPGCATDQLPVMYGDEGNLAGKTTTFLNNKVYNNCTNLLVYEVADYDTYVKKGSNVTTCTNFMTALFNNQSTVYRNEGIPIALKYLQVNTATDEYMGITSALSIRFLRKFGWVTKNVMHGCDVALLASTRFGSMGGVAWLRAVCRSYSTSDSSGSYGFANIANAGVTNFPTYSWNLMVMCHEMGHMVGSPHTHACCWNPPARNTAIDGCQTLEGSCAMPVPAYPTGGGTVMSYCHLQSVGINLSKGFGMQPGDTIRRYLRQRFAATSSTFPTCGAVYTPSVTLTKANRTITANRECTNIAGTDTTTYYWYDKNTASYDDDTLVLIIKKNSNYIANLDSAGFSVVTGTSTLYGSGRADTMAFPLGTIGASPVAFAMRRYWKINATATPATPVTVMYPISAQDTVDIDGSVPGATTVANLKMFKTNTAVVNPSPFVDSVYYTTPSNISVYTYAAGAPSTTNWSITSISGNMYATMKMTNLSGGGSGFYNSSLTGVDMVEGVRGNVRIFPNPTSDAWNITVEATAGSELTLHLYAADGRLITTQALNGDAINTVSAAHLPAGMYFYRIVSGTEVYTGAVTRQ